MLEDYKCPVCGATVKIAYDELFAKKVLEKEQLPCATCRFRYKQIQEKQFNKLAKKLLPRKLAHEVIRYRPKVNVDADQILIVGQADKGKTVLAATMMIEYYLKQTLFTSRANDLPIFSSVSQLLFELKRSFDTKDVKTYQIVEKYINASVLVLDDLGKEKLSEFSISEVFYILNERYNQERPTIFTSNKDIAELTMFFEGDGFIRRIVDKGSVIQLETYVARSKEEDLFKRKYLRTLKRLQIRVQKDFPNWKEHVRTRFNQKKNDIGMPLMSPNRILWTRKVLKNMYTYIFAHINEQEEFI